MDEVHAILERGQPVGNDARYEGVLTYYLHAPTRAVWRPINVYWDDRQALWTIHDGRHRVEAAREGGATWVPAHAEVRPEMCGHPRHIH